MIQIKRHLFSTHRGVFGIHYNTETDNSGEYIRLFSIKHQKRYHHMTHRLAITTDSSFQAENNQDRSSYTSLRAPPRTAAKGDIWRHETETSINLPALLQPFILSDAIQFTCILPCIFSIQHQAAKHFTLP